jgi:antitoxin ParD1/3/4
MDINLPPEMSAFIANLVATGRFATESDAVVEGIRLLVKLEQLRAEVQKGIDQLDNGEWVDGDEALDELEAEIDAMIARQQAGESNAAG